MRLITLQTKNTTYQMGVNEMGFLMHLYYGPRAEGDMSFLLDARDRGFSGNPYAAGMDRTFSPDVVPLEYPCYGNGDFRSPASNARDNRGVFGADLRFRDFRMKNGKYSISGLPAVYAGEEEAYTAEITLEDERLSLEVVLRYGVLPEQDVITRSVAVTNRGRDMVFLDKVYSTCIDFPGGEYDLLHFYGRHMMERNMERVPVIHGNQQFGSRRGMSGHQHNPFFILADKDTVEEHGSCYGLGFVYSGNFTFEAERDQHNQTRIQMGLPEEMFDWPLKRISDAVNAMGLKFGLWIEPEMVNEDSGLYREHPDWAFVIPGKKPVRCRNQLVLDFSRKEVVDYIFNSIAKVIDGANVEYINMDYNRSICDVFTAVEGCQNYGKIMYEYMLGVYDFLERMNRRWSDMLIEGCSGGGGRFDMGMLYYTPQIWCSDDTDAIERIRIHHGTSFCYPLCMVGSHVSAVPNHQTGRTVDFRTRGIVAMGGSFGYELDPGRLTDEEKAEVREQVRTYKENEHLMLNGDYFRLHTPGKDTEAAAWAFVSKDKNEALISIVSLDSHGNEPTTYIKIKGLRSDRMYHCEETGKTYSGAVLMHAGYPMPVVPGEYKAWQFHLRAQ